MLLLATTYEVLIVKFSTFEVWATKASLRTQQQNNRKRYMSNRKNTDSTGKNPKKENNKGNIENSYSCSQKYQENIDKLNFVHHKIYNRAQNTLQKIKNMDEKLNMILVFNAALFILLSVVFPITDVGYCVRILVCTFVSLFVATEIAVIVIIMIALFPQEYPNMPIDEYQKQEYYDDSLKSMLEKELNAEWHSAKNLEKILNKKSSLSIIVIILSVADVALVLTAVLITGIA